MSEAWGVSENQRAETRLTEYSRQLTSGGGKPGQGYPTVLISEPIAWEMTGAGWWKDSDAPSLRAQPGGTASELISQPLAVDLQNHSLSDDCGTVPAEHPREGHGYGVLISEPMGLRKQSSAAGGPVMLNDAMSPLDTDSGNLAVLTSSTGDSRVRTSAWPVGGPVYPASAAASGMSSSGCCESCGHAGWSLRMFPDCFPQTEVPTSVSYSGGWPSSGTGGPTGFWTRDSSECPSVAVASSLSDVLETRPVPRRYWLSARAAAGILRRAAKRGKELPTRLEAALRALADSTALRDGTPT